MKIGALSKMTVRNAVRKVFDVADNSSGLSAINCPQKNALETMISGFADNRCFSMSAIAPAMRTEVPLSRRGHNCPQGFQADKCPLKNPDYWPLLRGRALLARRTVNNSPAGVASGSLRAPGLGLGRLVSARRSLLPKIWLCRTLCGAYSGFGCALPHPSGREPALGSACLSGVLGAVLVGSRSLGRAWRAARLSTLRNVSRAVEPPVRGSVLPVERLPGSGQDHTFAASPFLGRLLRSRHGRPRRVARGSRQVALVRQKLVGSRTLIPSHVEFATSRAAFVCGNQLGAL